MVRVCKSSPKSDLYLTITINYLSVNCSCAQLPPPPRADPRALVFFCLGWQIPGGGILELSNPPGWGRFFVSITVLTRL